MSLTQIKNPPFMLPRSAASQLTRAAADGQDPGGFLNLIGVIAERDGFCPGLGPLIQARRAG